MKNYQKSISTTLKLSRINKSKHYHTKKTWLGIKSIINSYKKPNKTIPTVLTLMIRR